MTEVKTESYGFNQEALVKEHFMLGFMATTTDPKQRKMPGLQLHHTI